MVGDFKESVSGLWERETDTVWDCCADSADSADSAECGY